MNRAVNTYQCIVPRYPARESGPRYQPAAGIADPPPRELPPVEHWLSVIAEHDRNIGGTFAIENSQRDPRCVAAKLFGSEKEAADRSMAELRFHV